MASVGEEIQVEIKRVRDTVLPFYDELGPVGVYGATRIREELDAATKALAEGNVIQVLRSYEALKEITG